MLPLAGLCFLNRLTNSVADERDYLYFAATWWTTFSPCKVFYPEVFTLRKSNETTAIYHKQGGKKNNQGKKIFKGQDSDVISLLVRRNQHLIVVTIKENRLTKKKKTQQNPRICLYITSIYISLSIYSATEKGQLDYSG